MIGEATQALIADVFDDNRAFAPARQVKRRVVAWGGEPVELPHSAAVISEMALEAHLRGSQGLTSAGAPDWTIVTTPPLPENVQRLEFGTRIASACRIRLKDEPDTEKCWIESLKNGWLFLLPDWMLAVGAAADELLSESRVIANRIERFEPASGRFPAFPRICSPLSGSDWLACGSAAMAFDPICGDGAGNAVREAILATAVIRAGGTEEMLAHYRARLIAGFARHLELCRPFYAAIEGDWWRAELAELDRGRAWCREQLSGHEYRYQLQGFDLVKPIPNSAANLS